MKTAGGSLIAIPLLTAALWFGGCWVVRSPPGIEISLCKLCVLCVSVVDEFRVATHHRDTEDTEFAQRRRILNATNGNHRR